MNPKVVEVASKNDFGLLLSCNNDERKDERKTAVVD